MKKLVSAFLIAIVSVLICVLSLSYVNTVAQHAEDSLKNIQSLVSNFQYNSALREITELNKYWEDNQDLLSVILHHEILEEIEENLSIIKSSLEYLNNNNSNNIVDINFWLESARSLIKINNLKNTEEPNIANIF